LKNKTFVWKGKQLCEKSKQVFGKAKQVFGKIAGLPLCGALRFGRQVYFALAE